MNIVQATTTCLKKYFIFSGRAKRSEFWWFYLFTVIVLVVYTMFVEPLLLAWMMSIVAGGWIFGFTFVVLSNLTNLLFLVPTLAAGSRRLHDIGKSSWWLFLWLTGIGGIVLIVWWVFDMKPEGDKYREAVAETA